jgi:tetratricopeptide (TPR) repeat protein
VKHAAIAVWGFAFVLAVVFAGELRWAARALPLYLAHEFPPLQERVHAAEALRLANEEHDLAAALVEITASEAIDPNAFPFLHAELDRRAGQRDAALEHYERATFVDPFHASAWLRRAELLEELGRRDESRQVLREGLAWFAQNLLLFQPAPDPNVAPQYNAKAERTYTELQRAVTTLRTALSSTH